MYEGEQSVKRKAPGTGKLVLWFFIPFSVSPTVLFITSIRLHRTMRLYVWIYVWNKTPGVLEMFFSSMSYCNRSLARSTEREFQPVSPGLREWHRQLCTVQTAFHAHFSFFCRETAKEHFSGCMCNNIDYSKGVKHQTREPKPGSKRLRSGSIN